MFDLFLQELTRVKETKISEVFSLLEREMTAKEIEMMRAELATPDIRPMEFDRTVEGWLARIELWGKITYYHKDPENFWGKKKVTKQQFIKRITDENLNKMFGIWDVKRNSLTKCTLRRDYISPSGKHYAERFIVDIKLRKELR